MSKDENKCDNIQPYNIPKTVIENVVTPEVKILNRGDLLGAINCLFPELQLKSSRKCNRRNYLLKSQRTDCFITVSCRHKVKREFFAIQS